MFYSGFNTVGDKEENRSYFKQFKEQHYNC